MNCINYTDVNMLSSLCKAFLGRSLTGTAMEKKLLAIKVVHVIIDKYNVIAKEKDMQLSIYPTYMNLETTSLAILEKDAMAAYNNLISINGSP